MMEPVHRATSTDVSAVSADNSALEHQLTHLARLLATSSLLERAMVGSGAFK